MKPKYPPAILRQAKAILAAMEAAGYTVKRRAKGYGFGFAAKLEGSSNEQPAVWAFEYVNPPFQRNDEPAGKPA